MSEVLSSGASILLPDSAIEVFSNDEQTRNVILGLKDDWRFARVQIVAHEGNVTNAIEYYKSNNSPNLLIIETESIEDEFVNGLEGLAEYCNEGTSAIIVGPVNDISLYRKLVGMGVSDYIVKPLEIDDVSEIIIKSLTEKLGISDSKLICVVGAKGGVGTSAISYALAELVSDELGQKTLLSDAAGGWSYMARAMLSDEPAANMIDVAKMIAKGNDDSLDRVISSVGENLSILSTGTDDLMQEVISEDQYEEIIDKFLVNYPVVIVDLSMSSPKIKKMILRKAQKILMITNPTLPSLRSSRSLLASISNFRGGEVSGLSLIVNMKGFLGNNDVSKNDIETALGKEISLTLDYNPKLWGEIEAKSCRLSDVKGGSGIISKLSDVIDDVIGNSRKYKSANKKGILSILGKIAGS